MGTTPNLTLFSKHRIPKSLLEANVSGHQHVAQAHCNLHEAGQTGLYILKRNTDQFGNVSFLTFSTFVRHCIDNTQKTKFLHLIYLN